MITRKKLNRILGTADSITVNFSLPYYEINEGDGGDEIALSLYASPELLEQGDSPDQNFTWEELLAGSIFDEPEFGNILRIKQDGKEVVLQFFEHKVIDLEKV